MRIDLWAKVWCNRYIRIKAERWNAIMAIQKHRHDDGTPENDALLAIKISHALRSRIKRAANSSNLSVDEYLERVLEQAMQQEEEAVQTPQKPLSQEQLARVLQASEQISQSTQGQVFEDPVEVIRKMREERLQELE
jgi:hypothetical protein